MQPSDVRQTVFLACRFYDFQGSELLGVYTTRKAAEDRVADLPESAREITEIPVDEPMSEWMGG